MYKFLMDVRLCKTIGGIIKFGSRGIRKLMVPSLTKNDPHMKLRFLEERKNNKLEMKQFG